VWKQNPKNNLSYDIDVEILGHLFWYSIGQINITRRQLKDLLEESGFSEYWLPKPIRKSDAFRRATNEIQYTKRMSIKKTHHNYLVRETYNDREYVQRNVIIENVNQNRRNLDYNARAAILYLDKKEGKFSYHNESASHEVEKICKEAEHFFNTYCDCYNGQHIRSIVLNILQTLSPIAMKREGYIYFISVHLEEQLSRLTYFINLLTGNEANQVPFIHTKNNREMILRKLHDRYDFLLDKAKQDEKLRKDQLNTLVREMSTITDEFDQIQNVLSINDNELEDKNTNLKHEILRIS